MDVLWGQIVAWAAWLWSFWQVKFLTCHILLNVAVAVAATVYAKEFLLGKLGEFLYRKVLPYLLIFGAFQLLGEGANLPGVGTAAFAALEAMLLADLLGNLRKMGVPVPAALMKEGSMEPTNRELDAMEAGYPESDSMK